MGAAASIRGPLAGETMDRFSSVEKAVELGIVQWDNLTPEFQAIMDDVISGLEKAADFNPDLDEGQRGGDENAMYALACLLLEGRGVPKDEERAANLFRECFAREHLEGTHMLACCFYEDRGVGVKKGGTPFFNQFRGVKLFTMCAERNHAPSCVKLAEAYKSGVGVVKIDQAKSVEYYAKATNKCVADAWSELGSMYENGTGGMPKDESKAAANFAFGVENGNNKAKYHLGNMYMDGRGVKKDKTKGEALFKEAVDAGFANAQYHQAILLVKKDPFKAIGLLNHAAAQGHAKAKMQLDRVRNGQVIEDEQVAPSKKLSKGMFKFQKGISRAMLDNAAKAEKAEAQEGEDKVPDMTWDGESKASFDAKGAASLEPKSPFSPTLASIQRFGNKIVEALTPKRTPRTPK